MTKIQISTKIAMKIHIEKEGEDVNLIKIDMDSYHENKGLHLYLLRFLE